MKNRNLIALYRSENSEDAAFVRIDKKMDEISTALPFPRWDPDFYNPHYDTLLHVLSNHKLKYLDEFKKHLTSGYRGAIDFTSKGVKFLKVRNVLDTGIDLIDVDYVSSNSPADTENKRVIYGDIIINRSGTGSIGRMTVYTEKKFHALISGDVYLLRVKDINPFFINIVLNTEFGKSQVHRFESGVSGQTKIDLDEVLHLQIPILNNSIQQHIEKEYLKMSKFHDKAMECKKVKDITGYESNINKASKMLQGLIHNTEEVIRGKRKDVI